MRMWDIFDAFEKERLESYNSLLNAALSLTKLCGVLGIPVGLLLVLAYVHRVHSPLPVLDPSSAATLLIVAAVYGFLIIVLAVAIMFPAFSSLRNSKTYKTTQYLVGWKFSRQVTSVITYVIFHAGAILLIPLLFGGLSALAEWNAQFSPWMMLPILFLPLGVCPAISVAVFLVVIGGVSRPADRAKRKRVALTFKVWGASTAICITMFFWGLGLSEITSTLARLQTDTVLRWPLAVGRWLFGRPCGGLHGVNS